MTPLAPFGSSAKQHDRFATSQFLRRAAASVRFDVVDKTVPDLPRFRPGVLSAPSTYGSGVRRLWQK
jgi:hypothetical protein